MEGEHLLALGGLLVGVGEDLLEAAVLLDELGRALLADPRDAGQVVARVAHDAAIVGHEARRDAVALLDLLRGVARRVGDAAPGGEDADPLGDELEGVAVAGEDDDALPGGVGAGRQRADHVVGLEARQLGVDEAEGLHHRAEVRLLLAQKVRGRGPPGLVLLVALLAERPPRRVPADDDA